MVRKTGGAQSETCCPTVGTEHNVNDFDEEFETSINYNNEEIDNQVINEEQNEQTVRNDISCPLIPLITELGVSSSGGNDNQNSN